MTSENSWLNIFCNELLTQFCYSGVFERWTQVTSPENNLTRLGEVIGGISMEDIADSSPGTSSGRTAESTTVTPKIWSSRVGYLSSASRNGFSKSLGDLSHLSKSRPSHLRKTVAFEEDLSDQREVLQRARKRFHELELKYPEIFKDFSRTSSVAALASRSASLSQENRKQCTARANEMDTLRVPSDHKFYTAGKNSTITRRAPRLSVAMRTHNLEDSSDSAFDENMDRESVHSKTSHSDLDAFKGLKSRSRDRLNPCDSLESDKDSGISTDRPFIPQAPQFWPVRSSADDSALDLRKAKSLSLQALNAKSASVDGSYPDRRGILKSAAYKNQGNIRAEIVDLSALSETRRLYSRQDDDSRPEDKTRRLSKGSSIYQRALFQSYFSPDETDESDAETICSRRSEVILRPNMSARDVYFSTYQLNNIKTSPDEIKTSRVYKCRSMPELARNSLGSSTEMSFSDADAVHPERKKKKKKKKKFGRRSGLYIVNDTPAIEKPRRLSVDISTGRSKMKLFGRKKVKSDPAHINESTKQWFDNRTAVSRPSEGASLGRVISISGGLESAYKLELKRPKDGLFGFFIQKGYKQFRKGVFISRIVDSCSAKFLSGLLNPGDEILEINGESTKHKSIAEVHKIMADSHMLFLTVLPYLTRKDW